MTGSALPIALGLAAAALFGTAAVTSKRGMAHVEPQLGIIITLGSMVACFALTSPLWMRQADWFNLGLWVFLVNGVFHPLLSMYFWMEAIQRAGATVASTLTATAPLFASATAIAFLGESMTALVGIGTLATVAGVVALSYSPIGLSALMKTALLFATASALVRGLNHTVGKYGLSLMPNPMMAAFASCVVALVGSILLYRVRNGRFPTPPPRSGTPSMLLTGVMAGGGITCMYAALEVGDVVVVSPLVATYPLFTLGLALMLAMEKLTLRLVAGVVLVVGGVIAISLGRAG